LGNFGFQVVSGRVGSDIRSSSVESFRVYGRIRSGQVLSYLVLGHFEFWVISGWVLSHLVSDHFGFQIVLDRVGRISDHQVSGYFKF
jgi:hypothetical protein